MNTYLFDFDGTLVDSMPTYAEVMLRTLVECGVDYAEDTVKIITPLGLRKAAAYFRSLGAEMSEDALVAKMLDGMVYPYAHTIPAKDNVENVLRTLKNRGCSLNVLTASPHSTMDPCLERLGLFDLFENVWSCEDFGTTKTDPHIYEMAAERIGTAAKDILFLDDNLNADIAAKDAGMRVCGVYDPSSADYADEMRAATDYYIMDFAELLAIDEKV